MSYLDVYPNCIGCPVEKYCGTAIASTRLCNSYKDSKSFLSKASEEDEIIARIEMEADY